MREVLFTSCPADSCSLLADIAKGRCQRKKAAGCSDGLDGSVVPGEAAEDLEIHK